MKKQNLKNGNEKWKRKNPSIELNILQQKQISITNEVKYIIECAQKFDSRIVRLDSLVFFSTQTGDAWLLDPEGNLALCLAREGISQPCKILETDSNFGIEWNLEYYIDEDVFAIIEPSGSVTKIFGYPTQKIEEIIWMGK